MNYKVFIIGIELNSLVAKNAFESFLTARGDWKRISDGFYILKPTFATVSSTELKNTIPYMTYENGQIFVMRTSIDASWNLKGDIDGWLSANL